MTPKDFRTLPIVKAALKNPRSPRSILNYICACDTSDPALREDLSKDEIVNPLLLIWFASGTALDDLCQPFAPVVRELKSNPPTLVGENWESLEGKVAKVLIADQLSRSCFRGSAEAFSFDPIGRKLVRELVTPEAIDETLKLPPAILYLLPWALAHSEELKDLERACEIIDLAITAYPNFSLFEGSCQTNEPKHQYSYDGFFYEVTKDRHSVRAASWLSLNVLRFESDLCELNRL